MKICDGCSSSIFSNSSAYGCSYKPDKLTWFYIIYSVNLHSFAFWTKMPPLYYFLRSIFEYERIFGHLLHISQNHAQNILSTKTNFIFAIFLLFDNAVMDPNSVRTPPKLIKFNYIRNNS